MVFDQAPSIEESIHDLAIEGGLGLAFAVLIILVFLLSVRSTIITAISIPLSLLIAMIGLRAGDFSLNIFTLAALTVAVGRVVDDSIVVIENIKRHDVGPGPLTIDNIVTSVREVAAAVTASTLTTVAVFLPGRHRLGHHRRAVPAVLHHRGHRPARLAARVDDHRAGAGVLVHDGRRKTRDRRPGGRRRGRGAGHPAAARLSAGAQPGPAATR